MDGDNDGGEMPARPAEPMNIKFSDVSGFEVQFRLKPTTKLGKAMEAFSARTEKEVKSLRFLFEGDRVLPDTTPESVSPTTPMKSLGSQWSGY